MLKLGLLARGLPLVASLAACAPVAPPKAPVATVGPPVTTIAAPVASAPASASAPTAELTDAERELYRHGSVALRVPDAHPSDFVLEQDARPLTEAEFRKLYRETVHSNELDAIVEKRAAKRVLMVAATGTGLAVLGVGSVVLAALPRTGCMQKPTCPKGVGGALLLAGSGLYMVGCVAAKGARCLVDGDVVIRGAGLSREEAEHYVARYDAALVPRHPATAPGEVAPR